MESDASEDDDEVSIGSVEDRRAQETAKIAALEEKLKKISSGKPKVGLIK
jgi:hypothetical protein